ncbi:MAG: hypothetical protein AAFQ61_05485 [Cyanobacteria bacterium J06626_23]
MSADQPPISPLPMRPWQVWNYGRRWLGQGQPPEIRFVVFGAERCGKSILIDLLQQYGRVKCDRNLLSTRYFFPLWHVHHHALHAKADLYGFQLSSQDLLSGQRLNEPGQFLQLLVDQGYHIIHLHRQDMMRHAVSLIKAQQSVDAPTLKRQPIEVVPDTLLTQLAQLEQQRLEEKAILSVVPHLRITYETDLLDPNQHERVAHQLSSLFDTDWQPQPRSGLRLVHQQIADLIANYDEVRQALEQSDYAYVLSPQSMQLAI